jgi:RNA polymerase sigma-70 factor (ECF subfamily)
LQGHFPRFIVSVGRVLGWIRGGCLAPRKQSDEQRKRYEDWVRAFSPELYRYAYRLSGSHQVAEDLVQETFMEAWRSIDKQSGAKSARPWLFQILRYRNAHHRRDEWRDHQQVRLVAGSDADPPGKTRAVLDTLADQDALQLALNILSPAVRETLLMVYVQSVSCREAAKTLGIPVGTVLSRLDLGRRELRAALAAHSPAERRRVAVQAVTKELT